MRNRTEFINKSGGGEKIATEPKFGQQQHYPPD
jgi:hypothetical protein